MIANTTIFPKTVEITNSKTDQMLLLFIKIFGGVDIVLLSAYLVVCIYDRSKREKKGYPYSHGNSTLYENVLFSVSQNNWTFIWLIVEKHRDVAYITFTLYIILNSFFVNIITEVSSEQIWFIFYLIWPFKGTVKVQYVV